MGDIMGRKKPVIAYILAVVKTGKEYDVFEGIKNIDGVKEVVITYGLWDMIIKIEVDNLSKLDRVVTQVRNLSGIERTTTLIGV
ncbi:MAG: Lrp/AsnC family transcriptional regulator [Thermoprotei archaeon]|nr:MAG: Lrp/AsnC family transcriptional regulator [Thermoprotei archaeon]RLE81359.1 MAG: Lrp/AsnC family transcriptional regulator [Thermoprotei archaeon]RLF01626.1 MAG: Lrp/AsnC family transcriptional regulator [Thermoprotei archaeon]